MHKLDDIMPDKSLIIPDYGSIVSGNRQVLLNESKNMGKTWQILASFVGKQMGFFEMNYKTIDKKHG